MLKQDEISNPDSCLNRAAPRERLFILRGHDVAAPATIREWASLRVEMGKNHPHDSQIVEAHECALLMETERGTAAGTRSEVARFVSARAVRHGVPRGPGDRPTQSALTGHSWRHITIVCTAGDLVDPTFAAWIEQDVQTRREPGGTIKLEIV